jgi:purine-binding chemotaxis protein CheW
MNATLESNPSQKAAQKLAGKLLTFSLAGEYYALAVLKVREIIKLVTITPVPQMPGHVKGVVNLRGKIIPVVDLRVKFGMAAATPSDRTCIIVVQVHGSSHAMTALGLVVDSVDEVLNLAASDIEETPDFGTAVDTSYLVGMGKVKGKVVSLLDIDRVVGSDFHSALSPVPAPESQNSSATI